MCSESDQVIQYHRDDDMLMIGAIRHGKQKQGSKLVEESVFNSDEESFRKEQQRIFLAELDQMCSPINRSLDHLGQTFSCSKCDPRMQHLYKIPIDSHRGKPGITKQY